MNGSGNCPECGGPLAALQDGRTVGLHCVKCGWSVATTHFPPIVDDRTQYQLSVIGGDYTSDHQIRAVAEVGAINRLAAREKMRGPKASPIIRGLAEQIVVARDKLDAAGVPFLIEPDFPW